MRAQGENRTERKSFREAKSQMVRATTKVIQVESQQKHEACSIKGSVSIPDLSGTC